MTVRFLHDCHLMRYVTQSSFYLIPAPAAAQELLKIRRRPIGMLYKGDRLELI
jgi:hypothetical protein